MSKNASTFIHVKVEPDIEEIRKQLGNLSGKAPSVLKKALNDTAKWTGKELAREAQTRYRVKTMKFAKEFRILKATNGHLDAVIVASGSPLSVSKFQVSPAEPITSAFGSPAVKFSVLKDSGMRTATNKWGLKAFLTEYSSGHKAVVQRRPGKEYTSKGWKQRKNKWKDYLKGTGHLDDTRIKELYGPSVPKMLEKTGITKEYLESEDSKILEHLKKAVNKHIQTEIYFANKVKIKGKS